MNGGLRKLIPSLQTPKTPKETYIPSITLYTPKGCGEFKGYAHCRRPLS